MGAHSPPRGGGGGRRRTTLLAGGLLGGLLAVSGVWLNSYAAFTGETANAANAWAAASLTLTDDRGATAMFEAPGLVPGDTETKCIAVTYTSDAPAVVTLYSAGYDPGVTELEDHLGFVIEEGTGGSAGSCAGFTGTESFRGTAKEFGAVNSYAGGIVGGFAPTGSGQTRTYRITYTLDPLTPNTVEGGQVKVAFRWQAAAA
jgi:hypothetical protein